MYALQIIVLQLAKATLLLFGGNCLLANTWRQPLGGKICPKLSPDIAHLKGSQKPSIPFSIPFIGKKDEGEEGNTLLTASLATSLTTSVFPFPHKKTGTFQAVSSQDIFAAKVNYL